MRHKRQRRLKLPQHKWDQATKLKAITTCLEKGMTPPRIVEWLAEKGKTVSIEEIEAEQKQST